MTTPTYKINEVHEFGPNSEKYKFVDYHHIANFNPKKSWWIIPMTIEANLFDNALINNYFSVKKGMAYNLSVNEEKISQIGTNNKKDKLVIAVFRKNADLWHGYPGNHANEKDRPPSDIVDLLATNNNISNSIMRKLRRGQRT